MIQHIGDLPPEAKHWALTKHKSAHIRAEACEGLGLDGRDSRSMEILMKVLTKDKSPLVRGFAILALTQIAERRGEGYAILPFLSERTEEECSDWTRTLLLEGMIRLGDTSRFEELAEGLHHKEYRVRLMTASALRLLSERIFPHLRNEADALLHDALDREKNAEVREKLEMCLA